MFLLRSCLYSFVACAEKLVSNGDTHILRVKGLFSSRKHIVNFFAFRFTNLRMATLETWKRNVSSESVACLKGNSRVNGSETNVPDKVLFQR